MENIRKAHIKDGVAVTRFVYWLKRNIGKIPMDEVLSVDLTAQTDYTPDKPTKGDQ